jgi:single-strand DNA-binding protein
MSSLNKVQLIGHLGRDPEGRTMPSGDRVCNISLATTDTWKDKQSGEKMEATEWHRISFFGRLAEVVEEYTRTGSQIYVEGKLQTRKYTDKDGVERYSTEIRADSMQLLGSPRGEGGGGGERGGNDRGGQQRNQGDNGRGQQRQDTRGQGNGNSQGNQGGGRNSYADQRGGGGQRQAAPQQQRSQGNTTQQRSGAAGSSGFDDMDDDIPFVTSVGVEPSKSKRLRRADFR